MSIPAIHFEAVKIAFKQDKNGWVLTLAIHPNEVPESLMRDYVGQRYVVAMTALADDDSPRDAAKPEGKAKTRAEGLLAKVNAMLREPAFRDWTANMADATYAQAKECLHTLCKVKSLSEIKTDIGALETLSSLIEQFEAE